MNEHAYAEDGTPNAWAADPTKFGDLLFDVKDNLVAYSDVKTIYSDATRSQFSLGWQDNEFDKEVFLHNLCTGGRMCQIIEHYARAYWPQLEGLKPVRTVLNLGCPGSIYRSHTDDIDMNKHTLTVLYMANLKWEHGWGGEFKYYHPFTREIINVVEYKTGRMVLFDGNIEHSAAIIANHADFFRMTVAQNYA